MMMMMMIIYRIVNVCSLNSTCSQWNQTHKEQQINGQPCYKFYAAECGFECCSLDQVRNMEDIPSCNTEECTAGLGENEIDLSTMDVLQVYTERNLNSYEKLSMAIDVIRCSNGLPDYETNKSRTSEESYSCEKYRKQMLQPFLCGYNKPEVENPDYERRIALTICNAVSNVCLLAMLLIYLFTSFLKKQFKRILMCYIITTVVGNTVNIILVNRIPNMQPIYICAISGM